MSDKNTTSSIKNWWLAFRQPPVSFFGTISTKRTGARTKYIRIKFSSKTTLHISLRNFIASKKQRSKKYKQIVFPFHLVNVREIAIRKITTKKHRRKKQLITRSFFRPVTLSHAMMAIGVGGVIFYSSQLILSPKLQQVSAFSAPDSTFTENLSKNQKNMTRSAPVKIVAPSIGLESGIMEVGKLEDGSLETPPLFEHITGWYKYGPSPGQIGPSIIVGHVDTYKGPSVFWKLGKLVLNDKIIITRMDGEVVTYSVISLEQFDQNNFPAEKVYGNTLGSELRLITCGGTFDHQTGHYNKNTVVFAKIVPKSDLPGEPLVNSLVNSLNFQKLKLLN